MVPDDLAAALPWLTAEQMKEVDRAMVEDCEILLLQMMEEAGRHLARLARDRFRAGDAGSDRVVVLAGPGGNGGGALVCARRLAGWGSNVSVITTAPDDDFADEPRHQLRIVRHLGLDARPAVEMPHTATPIPPALIIDGIFGYGLRGAPRGRAAELIQWANDSGAPILSLDVPSGLDATTGEGLDPVISATATMTLALPKRGLRAGSAPSRVGELYLADIGVPPQLYARPPLGLSVPSLFGHADLVRLR